jgi:tRNA A37 threonylcarbamoyltransferase TsaD
VTETDIIAEATATYHPATGGIHPREAAQHHATTNRIAGQSLYFDYAHLKPKSIYASLFMDTMIHLIRW